MKKRTYETPRLEVLNLCLEQSLVAGSALVIPEAPGQEITQEWEIAPEQSIPIVW